MSLIVTRGFGPCAAVEKIFGFYPIDLVIQVDAIQLDLIVDVISLDLIVCCKTAC